MMQSKMAKAKRGEVISRLPVGWVKGPDGKYGYDPETQEIIQTIIDTFRQKRAIYGTVKALAKAGVQIPCGKRGGKLCFKKPTATRVTFILTHPAYTGSYVFARTEPGGPVPGSRRLKLIKLSEEHCIKIPNHHPAYLTTEEQKEIKSTLRKNQFKRCSPVARERTVIQGLLRSALCGTSIMVGTSFRVSLQHLWGDALGLVTAVFYAGYILTVKQLREESSVATIMTKSRSSNPIRK